MTSITYLELQKRFSANPKVDADRPTIYLAKLVNGTTRELTDLTLGRNYVSATLENGSSKVFIMHQGLLSLAPASNQCTSQIGRTHKTIGEMLFQVQFPFTAQYWYQANPAEIFRDRVQATLRGFMVLERQATLIPLAPLGYLELEL